MLVVLTTVISPTLGGQAVSAICTAAGVLWLTNILWCVARQCGRAAALPHRHRRRRRFMPATVHEMNQAQVAAAMVFTFAALSSSIVVGMKDFDAAVSQSCPRTSLWA